MPEVELEEHPDVEIEDPPAQYDNNEKRWLLVAWNRDINGQAGMELYWMEDVDLYQHREWKRNDSIQLKELTDAELYDRLSRNTGGGILE